MKLDERIEGFKRTPAPDLWPEIERREPVTELTPVATGWRRLAIVAAALAIGAAALILVVRAYPRHDAAVPSNPTAANGVIAYAPIGEQQVFWTISSDGSEKTKVPVDVPGFVGVPSWSPDGSEIAFAVNSYDDPHPEAGNWDIYVANADGSDPKRLTTDRVDHTPAWSPDSTQIAYVYGYDSDQQIRVMNADGSDMRELTSDNGFHSFPTWSPDGSQIAYVGFEGTNANIYVMNADGSGSHQVTDDPAHEDAPAWSPDGRLIAFTSEGGSRDPGIYTMSPDGTGVAEWAHDPDPANLGIAWSPDGTKMALVSIRGLGNDRNVYVLDVASGEVAAIGQPGAYFGVSWQPASKEVVTSPANEAIYFRVAGPDGNAQVDAIHPDGADLHVAFPEGSPLTNGHLAWAADGSRVAFDAYYGDRVGISTADPSGASVTPLTSAVNDTWPSWSPDGKKIAFASTRYDPSIEACPTGVDLRCQTDIYVMNSDGSDVTRLTSDPAPEWNPVWSPDGAQIAFVRGESETEVFVMQADGSDVRQVTTTEGGSGFTPSWSPDGTQIVFGSIQYEDWGIFVVSSDGTNERPLLFDNSTYAVEPVWSPNGSLIAFTGQVGSARMGLYAMRPDGSGVAEISTEDGDYDSVSWGPVST
jgi:Tol biopolymer transport system component